MLLVCRLFKLTQLNTPTSKISAEWTYWIFNIFTPVHLSQIIGGNDKSYFNISVLKFQHLPVLVLSKLRTELHVFKKTYVGNILAGKPLQLVIPELLSPVLIQSAASLPRHHSHSGCATLLWQQQCVYIIVLSEITWMYQVD